MFCPDTKSKLCIYGDCPAYQAGISIHKCIICNETFQLGGSCNEIGHKRTSEFLKESPGYCKKYKIKIKKD